MNAYQEKVLRQLAAEIHAIDVVKPVNFRIIVRNVGGYRFFTEARERTNVKFRGIRSSYARGTFTFARP